MARAGAGVALPQFAKVTPAGLADAIGTCLQPEVQAAAAKLGTTLCAEDGLQNASDELIKFYNEEVRTGVFAAAFEKNLAARCRHRKRSFFRGGLVGGLYSMVFVLRALLIGWR